MTPDDGKKIRKWNFRTRNLFP